MGLVKNYYHDEIIAAQDDQRADEFDFYEARLHSLLSDLDWLVSLHGIKPLVEVDARRLRNHIQRMMK